ncbi:MAG: hypothetical protein WBC06_14765 [Chitinophagaceae bacterium]
MDLSAISLVISAIALAVAAVSLFRKPTFTSPSNPDKKPDLITLRLQAYERLVLLTERISLPNIISRLNQTGISAAEMKLILTENIKQEFEYNSTQQLYVSPVSWDAVRNLKEQNIMLVHQVANSLPDTTSATELNKKILELLIAQPGGALHEMVLQALNFEAKKLMK